MRVIVNCTGGGSHSMMLLQHTTVQSVKAFIAEQEGTPVDQQSLLFAGRALGPDSALLLDDLQLDTYSLADEVVLYMQPQLLQPVRVYLSSQPGSPNNRLHSEFLEAHSSLANVQELLQQRQLACKPFPGSEDVRQMTVSNSNSTNQTTTEAVTSNNDECTVETSSSHVVVKRRDGSCCSKAALSSTSTLRELMQTIHELEGQWCTNLCFYQAQDGCLHAVFETNCSP